MAEQADQNDKRDGNSQQQKQYRTHSILLYTGSTSFMLIPLAKRNLAAALRSSMRTRDRAVFPQTSPQGLPKTPPGEVRQTANTENVQSLCGQRLPLADRAQKLPRRAFRFGAAQPGRCGHFSSNVIPVFRSEFALAERVSKYQACFRAHGILIGAG